MQLEVPAPASITEVVSQVRTRSFWRVVFSFPVALSGSLVALMLLTVRSRFSDPDLWWHLKTGQIIWNTRHIPRVDLFSYTAGGHSWIAQEWLSQLTIYGAYHFGGYTGLMLWLSVLGSLVLVTGYLLCSLYSGNLKVAFLGALGIWLFSTVGLSIRPQLIGFLLLLCELVILHLGRSRNPRWFLLLPPLFALWINCHGSFLFGLIVLAVILCCSFLEMRAGLLISQRWDRPHRNGLILAFVLSIGALFLNPIGPKLIWYPLDIMFNQPLNLLSVSEWQQPDFAIGRSLAVLVVAGLILIVPSLRRVQLRLYELILVTGGFWFAVRHERMLFVFGILAMPVLCRLLATAWDRYEPDRDRILPNAGMLAVSAVVVISSFPSPGNLDLQVKQANPVKALDFIRHAGFSGRMLNDYVYGGYLIWTAPERKVFIDGRADLYEPAGVLAEYGKWYSLQADPRGLLNKYGIGLCLLPAKAPISQVMLLLPGWKLVYSDKFSAVFLRSEGT